MDSDKFEMALDVFCAHALKLINESYAWEKYKNTLNVNRRSRRYVKIVHVAELPQRDQISVYCFIDARNGDVLKANSWSSPHLTPRGNIFTPDNYGVEWYGAKYLRVG